MVWIMCNLTALSSGTMDGVVVDGVGDKTLR